MAPLSTSPGAPAPAAHAGSPSPRRVPANLSVDVAVSDRSHSLTIDSLSHPTSGRLPATDGPAVDQLLHPDPGRRRSSAYVMEKYYSIDATSHRTDDIREQRRKDGVKRDVSALLILGFVMPFVSIPICIYSLVILLGLSFAAPVLFPLWGKDALKAKYQSLLLPGLNLHFRMARSSRRCAVESLPRHWPGSASPQSPVSSSSSVVGEKTQPSPSVAQLAKVLLLSPIPALVVMIANIVIGIFWPLSALTESAGSSSSMDDGRLMCKRVRRLWVHWLSGELERGWHSGSHSGHTRRSAQVSYV